MDYTPNGRAPSDRVGYVKGRPMSQYIARRPSIVMLALKVLSQGPKATFAIRIRPG